MCNDLLDIIGHDLGLVDHHGYVGLGKNSNVKQAPSGAHETLHPAWGPMSGVFWPCILIRYLFWETGSRKRGVVAFAHTSFCMFVDPLPDKVHIVFHRGTTLYYYT